jgi:tripartite-type tricarboxylate transporter receptor subunit TctC
LRKISMGDVMSWNWAGPIAAGMLAVVCLSSARAETDAEFYHGRTVSLMIGYTPGGGYDAYGRLLARSMSKHLPGAPMVVPQNMPGAGSLTLANYLYNIAPKDGSVFGIFGRGLAMAPLLGQPGTRFDATKFTWIGNLANEVSLCVTGKDSPVKTLSDAMVHEFTVGGEGSGSDPDVFAIVLHNVFGAHIRLVSGYPGGNEILLALERGEVDGRCGWSLSSVKSTRPAWLSEHKVNVVVQLSLAKSPDLPDVPLITDFAQNEGQMQIARLIFSRQLMAWPFAAPPGLSPGRAESLRAAFDAAMRDPDFVAETQKLGLDLAPMSGAEIQELVAELYRTPPEIVAAARDAITPASH